MLWVLLMALNVATGSFNITTGTSDVVLTPGFTARAIMFWYVGRTESTDTVGSASFRRGVGFVAGINAGEQGCMYSAGDDAGAAMVTCRGHRKDACIVTAAPSTNAIDGRAHVSAISSTQVTITIDDAFPTDLRVAYRIIGDDGSNVTQAYFNHFALNTITGTQDITAPGFQPNSVEFLFSPSSTAPPDDPTDNESSIIGYGMGTSSSARYCIWGGNDDGSAAGDSRGDSYSTEVIVSGSDSSPTTVGPRAGFNGMLSNGFQVNVVEAGAAIIVYYLCIKGPQAAVSTLSGSTSLNGTTTVSGLAFAPRVVTMFSTGKVAGTVNASTSHDTMSGGFATSTSNRVAEAMHDEDLTASQECATAIEHDEVVIVMNTSDGEDALYDMNAFNSDGFQIICDDAPTSVAPFIGALSHGDFAAAGAGPTYPELERVARGVGRGVMMGAR